MYIQMVHAVFIGSSQYMNQAHHPLKKIHISEIKILGVSTRAYVAIQRYQSNVRVQLMDTLIH